MGTKGGNTNFRGVVGCSKDQLWCTVIAGTDVGNIGFILNKDLGGAKITKFQYTRGWVEEEVLRFDISVAYSLGVNVCQGAEQLVNVKFNLQHGHCSFQLVEISRRTIDRLGNIFENKIQVDLVFLPAWYNR